MTDDDLLAFAHTPEKVGEEVASVPGVELGEVARRGVATWRGLATPSEKAPQHSQIVPVKPRQNCAE
jgi:hypothetical protein